VVVSAPFSNHHRSRIRVLFCFRPGSSSALEEDDLLNFGQNNSNHKPFLALPQQYHDDDDVGSFAEEAGDHDHSASSGSFSYQSSSSSSSSFASSASVSLNDEEEEDDVPILSRFANLQSSINSQDGKDPFSFSNEEDEDRSSSFFETEDGSSSSHSDKRSASRLYWQTSPSHSHRPLTLSTIPDASENDESLTNLSEASADTRARTGSTRGGLSSTSQPDDSATGRETEETKDFVAPLLARDFSLRLSHNESAPLFENAESHNSLKFDPEASTKKSIHHNEGSRANRFNESRSRDTGSTNPLDFSNESFPLFESQPDVNSLVISEKRRRPGRRSEDNDDDEKFPQSGPLHFSTESLPLIVASDHSYATSADSTRSGQTGNCTEGEESGNHDSPLHFSSESLPTFETQEEIDAVCSVREQEISDAVSSESEKCSQSNVALEEKNSATPTASPPLASRRDGQIHLSIFQCQQLLYISNRHHLSWTRRHRCTVFGIKLIHGDDEMLSHERGNAVASTQIEAL
jgi:hypothetical protein